MTVTELVEGINRAIVYPLVILLTAIALLVFLWGVFRFVAGAGDEEARRVGKRTMLFGIIGLFIMLAAVGILNVFLGTFDIPLI